MTYTLQLLLRALQLVLRFLELKLQSRLLGTQHTDTFVRNFLVVHHLLCELSKLLELLLRVLVTRSTRVPQSQVGLT